ncbi:MAG: sigma-54 dependent transcriptional regulator [Polyangiaceae bacterium]|nr:sigma-54 dependent transcriptional regulator [Polyangiaceae bacterium]
MMLPEKKQVLVADDEANLRRVLSAILTRDGYEVHAVEDGKEALEFLQNHHLDLVITDLRMPNLDGMALLREVQAMDLQLPVIVLTAHGTVDNAVEALKLGAIDYLTKPFDQTEIRNVVRKALRTRDLSQADAPIEPSALTRSSPGARYGIIGRSPKILEVYSILDRVADSPTTVLITGESGTGKELVARALHENSSRKDKPFIKVNCAAIPKDLMESELFGHERGAFTHAISSKPGRFELADKGTLFLDEVGELTLEMQSKLLRVLQESEFERVGGIKTIRVNVRLVAATNRDLKKEIAQGTFREDLFYRLNVVPIPLPALRERSTDIPLLVDFFLTKFNQRLKKQVTGLSPGALARLVSYSWPGNIRELENVLERAVLFADGSIIQEDNLSQEVRASREVKPASPAIEVGHVDGSSDGLKEKVKAAASRIERELIIRALDQTSGNVTHAARLLKISRKGLQLKMKELGLREREEG